MIAEESSMLTQEKVWIRVMCQDNLGKVRKFVIMMHDWKLHFKINVIMDRELSNNNVAFAKLDTYVVVVHILNNLRSYSPSSNIV